MPEPKKENDGRKEPWPDPPFLLHAPTAPTGPLILSSPHSGRNYTALFRAASRLDAETLRLSEDCFVDELFASAPAHGATLIAATYPRAYVDVNREPMELDPRMFYDRLPAGANTTSDRVAAGLGVIARVVCAGAPIYDGKLLYADEKARIETIYRPYHAALQALIDQARARAGFAILIDCHSMPSMQPGAIPQTTMQTGTQTAMHTAMQTGNRLTTDPVDPGNPYPDPDIILGDRFGASCAPQLTSRIEMLLRDMGYSVARNNPYAGGYCTIRHGKPRAGLHAIQIEINRRLYMDEPRIKRRRQAMRRVANDMDRLIGRINALEIMDLDDGDRMAAE